MRNEKLLNVVRLLLTGLFAIVMFSACGGPSEEQEALERAGVVEPTRESPAEAAKAAFEIWAQQAGMPYRNDRYSVLKDDGTFATVRVIAQFRETAESEWLEEEAIVECRNVGGKWQADTWMYFEITQEEKDRIRIRQEATATAEAVRLEATATAQAEQLLSSYYQAGMTAYEEGEWWEAAYNLRRLIDLAPSYEDASTRLAEARGKLGKIGVTDWDGGLYLMWADGGDPVRILTEDGFRGAAWSPDGSKIAYVQRIGPYDETAIFIMGADGTGRQVLLRKGDTRDRLSSASLGRPFWAPDATRIVASGQFGGLYVIDVRAGSYTNPECTVGSWVTAKAWSPDSRTILFFDTNSNPHGGWHIYDVESGSCSRSSLSTDFITYSVAWSPDGKTLVLTDRSCLYTAHPDGSGLTKLDCRSTIDDPAWSPDGRKIIYDSSEGLAVIDATGGDPYFIAEDQYGCPTWLRGQ